MFYIHTLSMIRFVEKDEIDALKTSYKKHFLYIREKGILVLNAFLDHGLRVEISPIPTASGVRRFNENHPRYKAELFITPAKLLDPGINLGGLTSRIDISDACYHLERIMASIENESGINLMTGAVLSRVDVTKDVIMPSDLYSRELIRAAKKSINKHGFIKKELMLYFSLLNSCSVHIFCMPSFSMFIFGNSKSNMRAL